MRSPLVLVASASPGSSQLRKHVLNPLRSLGFAVEAFHRLDAVAAVERQCVTLHGRPDALLFAPEFGTPSPSSNDDSAFDLSDKIRGLRDTLLFPGKVRAKTLPIVVACYGDDMAFNRSADRAPSLRWFAACSDPKRLIPLLLETIREWRQSLLDERPYVGYALTRVAGAFAAAHALQRRRREGDIVADVPHADDLRRQPFYLLPEDAFEDLPDLKRLEWLLNHHTHVARKRGVKPETILQEFFEQNPHMLLRGLFDRNIPKPSLPRVAQRPLSPDFVQLPRAVSVDLANTVEILDLKTPGAQLLAKKSARRIVSSELMTAIQQLLDYERYATRPDRMVRNDLRAQLDGLPRRAKLAVVIGRRIRDKDEAEEFRVRQEQVIDPLRVQVVTYDDILDIERQRVGLQLTLTPQY